MKIIGILIFFDSDLLYHILNSQRFSLRKDKMGVSIGVVQF